MIKISKKQQKIINILVTWILWIWLIYMGTMIKSAMTAWLWCLSIMAFLVHICDGKIEIE